MKKQIEQIKCKKCPYYTGIQCHGHGEYWGECALIKAQRKIIAKLIGESPYDIELKKYETSWCEALDDESTCLIFEIRK